MSPGTRVRVTSDRMPHYNGKVGTVMQYLLTGQTMVVVEIHPGSYAWFYPCELAEEST